MSGGRQLGFQCPKSLLCDGFLALGSDPWIRASVKAARLRPARWMPTPGPPSPWPEIWINVSSGLSSQLCGVTAAHRGSRIWLSAGGAAGQGRGSRAQTPDLCTLSPSTLLFLSENATLGTPELPPAPPCKLAGIRCQPCLSLEHWLSPTSPVSSAASPGSIHCYFTVRGRGRGGQREDAQDPNPGPRKFRVQAGALATCSVGFGEHSAGYLL